MSDVDLDLLRSWSPDAEPPSAPARAQARARLEQQYDLTPIAATVTTRSAPAAKRFGKRLAVAALAAAVLIAGAIVFVQRAVDDRVSELKTVTVPPGSLGSGEVGHGPVNILVVGSDQRDGSNVTAFGDPKDLGLRRSDTMFILRIDGPSVQALWLPRDLLITTAAGTQDVLNSTFSQGPAALIAAIKTNFDVSVDHYVELNFASFSSVVDTVGGVPIYSPGQVRDKESGLDLSGPGCRTLDGSTALAWVRSRDLQLLRNGVWTNASPRADLDREARQQELIRALARKAKATTAGDPVAAVRLADAIIPALLVDAKFSRAEILGLVRSLIDVDPASLQLATLPVQESTQEPGRLSLEQPEADRALNPLRGSESSAPVSPTPTAPTEGAATPTC